VRSDPGSDNMIVQPQQAVPVSSPQINRHLVIVRSDPGSDNMIVQPQQAVPVPSPQINRHRHYHPPKVDIAHTYTWSSRSQNNPRDWRKRRMRASLRLMASPRPVPPKRRAVKESA
jgi:hypothetical protein